MTTIVFDQSYVTQWQSFRELSNYLAIVLTFVLIATDN